MMELLNSPLLLLAVALGLRLLPLRMNSAERWRTPVELALALGVGLLAALIKAWWLAPHAMTDGTDTSDLPDICITVEALRAWDIESVQRQPMAAVLPTLLSFPLGLFDGVAAGALTSAAVLGAAMYLWARVLHSRTAGVAAAMFSCAFSCYVVMPRYMTFYPECIAAYALCAAATAAALRWRTLTCLGLAGAGVGLSLSVDHTGLLYALVPLAVAAAVAIWGTRTRRRIPLRLAVLLAPVLLSWGAARAITPRNMPTLEDKATVFTADNVGHQIIHPTHDIQGSADDDLLTTLRRWAYPRVVTGKPEMTRLGYNWGHGGPLAMTRALATLALLTLEEPTAEVLAIKDRRWSLKMMRDAQVLPWIPLALAALMVTVVALWRRRWELVGLVVMLVPYAVLLRTVANTQVWPKYLMAPMLPVPVLLGVAWAFLAHRATDKGEASRWAPVVTPALAVAIIGLAVTGLVPGWFAPDATRRERTATDAGFYKVSARTPTYASNPRLQACYRLFRQDRKRGVPTESRLYPRAWFEERWEQLRAVGAPPGHTPPALGLPPAVPRPPPVVPAPPPTGPGSG